MVRAGMLSPFFRSFLYPFDGCVRRKLARSTFPFVIVRDLIVFCLCFVGEGDDAAIAYKDAVDRFLGKTVELKFLQPKPVGLVG